MEAKSSGQRSDGVKRMNGSQRADNSQRTSIGQRMNSGQQIEKSSYMQIDSLSSASGSSGYSSEQGRSTKLKSTNLADPEKVDLCKLVNGRELKTLTYTKEGPLGVALEGGTDSKKHNGRVVVAEIFPTGSIYKYGGLEKGSQLMMVNGRSLLGITLTQAQEVLKEVILGPGDSLTLVVATQKKDDDTTYL
ncbi:PREDICTED: harmonin-like isoform X2 [Priapulus caudatus]|uniref:Harmonin-like isoform X2 n=1 Tax=Priapulus caudatus TaxID=37621 RepID=A0ABM1EEY9_PRICU|nr:PREDICTED: harmonin-like isoform X2 [Priapulus caudatus]